MYRLGEGTESDGETDEYQDGECPAEYRNFWRTIGAAIKYFRFSYHEVLWEISWVNLNMLIISIPKSKFDKKKSKSEYDTEEIEDFGEIMGAL